MPPPLKRKKADAGLERTSPTSHAVTEDEYSVVYSKGESVWAYWKDKWFQSKIMGTSSCRHPHDKNRSVLGYKVHYANWGSKYDEWVMSDCLMARSAENDLRAKAENEGRLEKSYHCTPGVALGVPQHRSRWPEQSEVAGSTTGNRYDAREMAETIPKDLKNLRACLLCSSIKTFDQFLSSGCENCADYLQMKGHQEAVFDYTSANFDGMIAMMSPPQSWVAKWQRIDKFVPGVYAVSVSGSLPADIVRELKSHGIYYKPRDSSQGLGR